MTTRKSIPADVRERVRVKCAGPSGTPCCAYCGEPLGATWHVDHMTPLHRGGTNDAANLMPACPPCNGWKATYTVEEYRAELAQIPDRLRRDSGPYRMALRMGLVAHVRPEVEFWFEQVTP